MSLGLSGVGRFSEAGLLILMSLAGGSKHGYGILLDVQPTFEVRLGIGTLYQALERLEDQGLIEPLPPQDRRRPYHLTPTGEQELAAQLRTMQRFSAVGLQRLAPS